MFPFPKMARKALSTEAAQTRIAQPDFATRRAIIHFGNIHLRFRRLLHTLATSTFGVVG